MMDKRLIGVLFGAAAVLAAGSAKAGVVLVTYVDTLFSGSWEQYDDPTPDADLPGELTQISIWNLTGNLPFEDTDHVTYYTDGGFWDISGPRVFAGREQAPLFPPRTLTGFNYPLSSTPTNGVLTITELPESAIPELSTWGMILAGFAGLGAVYAGNRWRSRAA